MANLREKFSKVYDENIEKIYRFIFLKVNSKETAEDLTSKVFLKGWESFKKTQNPIPNTQHQIEHPRAFLYQIARNTVIDYYRERGRTKVISAEFAYQMSDPRTNLEEKAFLNSDLEIVKKAIQELSDDYQHVVIWHYLDDLSIPEVAKLLDRTEEATRVLLHRALKSLKEKINIV